MVSFFKRISRKYFLQIRINLLWKVFKIKYFIRINKVCRVLDIWNKEISSFQYNFPDLNRKTFLMQYKYWIYWITQMDQRERLIFKALNPYVLIAERKKLYLDLSREEIPVICHFNNSPYSPWLSAIVFTSIEEFQGYLTTKDATSGNLNSMINSKIKSAKRLFIRRFKNNVRENNEFLKLLEIKEEKDLLCKISGN